MPIVLLPGIRGDGAEMAPLAEALAGRRGGRVHRIDLPTLTARGTTLHEHAAALAALLPPGPNLVVAASFGALVARALPPGHMASLVAIGALPCPSRASRRCRLLAPLVRRLPPRAYAALYGVRAEREWRADDPDPLRYSTLALPPQTVLAARLDAIGRWGLPLQVTTPTVWIWGASDPHARWTPDDVTTLGARAVVLPGAHRPHLSHPSAVAEQVPSG